MGKMKFLAIVLCLGVVAPCFAYHTVLEEEWNEFKAKYSKIYKSEAEEKQRFGIFLEQKLRVAKHNQEYYDGKKSYYMAINEFSDKNHQEFIAVRHGFKRPTNLERGGATYIGPDEDVVLPDSIDWRTKGAVTPVKDQGDCGSCWAFSTTGTLEGQHFRKTGKLVSLSEQNIIDCDELDYGCDGGLMEIALQYVQNNSGIDTEASYPYAAYQHDSCQFNNATIGATDSGYVFITVGDEEALKKAVATVGPVAVAFDASPLTFDSYSGGIWGDTNCSTTILDHAVLVVGYGTTEEKEDYWLVKNSWGTDWGMEGYFMIARNKNNMCGIASHALYPLV